MRAICRSVMTVSKSLCLERLKIPRSVRQDVPTHQDGGQIQETLMNVCVTFVSDEQPTEAV
jgi:hypothetical protein